MRTCFVSTEIAGFRGGGIGTYVAEAGKALTGAGHEVWLVTRDPGPERRDALRAIDGFARVLFVEDAADDPTRFRFALARDAYWFSALAHETIAGSGVEFDYIEFPDFGAEGYVSVLEQRLFDTHGDAVLGVTLHSPTFECYRYNQQLHAMTPALRELCALEEDAIRNAQLLCCPSTRLLEIVTARLGLERQGHVVRYPMELPADLPSPTQPRRSLDELRFAYFGRIEPRKGVDSLIDAFRRLPELSIELIGADRPCSPYGTSNVEWLSRRLPPNVRFRAPMPRDRLLAELAAIDVCVFPSRWENWPNACIEAMAAGRVVLGGRHGGMGEMIEHGTSGLLVDGDDADDIVRVIRDDLGSALGRLDELGSAAARRIRELSAPARYAAVVERLVDERRSEARPRAARPDRSPKVSIIVPYYKEDAALVGEAIDSAIAQTHENTEILIVDDGSPRPDASSILESLAGRDPRIRVLHKPNGGLSSARNFSIGHATGEYYAFLDADNVMRPEYVATGLEVFERFADVAAIAPLLRIFDDATKDTTVVINPLPFERSLSLFRNELGDAGAMFRASVFKEHGLRYDSVVDMYSDWALWLDCARAGLKVQCVPRVLYDYRQHGASMMAEQAWDLHLALLGLMVERHMVPGDAEDERRLLTTLVQGWGVGALLAALGGRPEFSERPTETAKKLRASTMRYRAADAVAQLVEKIPGLSRALRPLLVSAFRWHGKWKDRRRGRKPV